MSSSNSPCAACKFLRRKCTQECDFAPYFLPENPQRFANVHRVFGASNVAKLLKELDVKDREDAVKSLAYEAESRIKDPVYGCVGVISILQQKLRETQNELTVAKKELAGYNLNPQTMQCLLMNSGTVLMPQQQQQQQQWNSQFAAFANYPNNFPQEMVGGGGLVMQQQQEHELQMGGGYQVTPQEYLLRSGGGYQMGGGHQMGPAGGGVAVSDHADVAHPLVMGNFDNGASGGAAAGGGGGYYQIQQQGGEQQHNYHVGVAHANPVEAQLLLSPQNQEAGEDGKSGGSAHRSS